MVEGEPDTSQAVRPEELAAVELLARLPAEALEDLAHDAERRRYRAGEAVFNEGEIGETLHIVAGGLLKVVRAADPKLVLNTLKPGQAFGELAILDSAPRSATVAAIDASELIEVGKGAFERALDRHPEAVRAMFGAMARSLTLAKDEVSRHNQILEEKVRERTAELRETQLEVIRRLAQAAEFRDEDTGLHITRMSRVSARLAEAAGLGKGDAEMILYAAPMHDIGKIGIPDRVLLKPGKLDEEEWELMKSHTVIGARLLGDARSELMHLAQQIAIAHHERWDGSGYPHGLRGEEIPLAARICTVADVFDALISKRPYKEAWPPKEAAAEVEAQSGKIFDPRLADLFGELLGEVEAIVERAAREEEEKKRAEAAVGESVPAT